MLPDLTMNWSEIPFPFWGLQDFLESLTTLEAKLRENFRLFQRSSWGLLGLWKGKNKMQNVQFTIAIL
jgi:hypothetical protein